MICIVCKSKFLSSQIKEICSRYVSEKILEVPFSNLLAILKTEKVRLVFFDCAFFTDSAEYRRISLSTRFIVIAGAGFEVEAEKAICCGASGVILCPDDENGVIHWL